MSSEVNHESKDEIQADTVSRSPDLTQHVSHEEEKLDQIRSQALTAETDTLPENYHISWRFIGTFAGISISLTTTYFAFEASAGCLVQINQEIGPSPNYYLYSIVWVIGQTIGLLMFGRNSDIFGRRNFALGSNIVGIIGAIIAVTSHNINQLIVGNAILGLASGVPNSFPLLAGELMSNKLKFLGSMIVLIPNIVATGFGPYIGQRLAITSSWRWIFYIYIILISVATVIWYFTYFPPSYTQLHGAARKREAFLQTDFLGSFLLVAGLILFMLGVSFGGPDPWSSGLVLGLLISGAASLVSFVIYEIFGNVKNPIIPMRFFRDVRGFTCVVIISAITGCLQEAMFIMWPSQVVYIFGSTSPGWQQIAWMSSIINFAAWAGIMMIGPLYHLVKHLRLQLVVGMIFTTAFMGAMSTISHNNRGRGEAFAFLGVFPLGWGELLPGLMVQYIVSEQELGVAYAVVASTKTILGTIFSSIFVSIYSNKLPGQLEAQVIPAVAAAGLPASSIPALLATVKTGSQAALLAVPGMTPSILKVANDTISNAYAASYAYVYYTAVALGGVGLIAALCLRDFDHYLNDHVARQIYHKRETKYDILEKTTRTEVGEATEVREVGEARNV